MKDPSLVTALFVPNKNLNKGRDLTPPGSPTEINEPLPYDYFQMRLSQIPKTISETGLQDIFLNPFPTIPDINDYLNRANFKIVHGFPRETADLPCISITLGNEDESQYLSGYQEEFNGDLSNKVILGSDFRTQYNLSVITPNYDETELWYFIMKYSLMKYRAVLEGYGLREQSMSFMDIEPASEYVQAGLFVYQRTLILSCVKEERIEVPEFGYNELGFQVTDQGVPYPQGNGSIIPEPL